MLCTACEAARYKRSSLLHEHDGARARIFNRIKIVTARGNIALRDDGKGNGVMRNRRTHMFIRCCHCSHSATLHTIQVSQNHRKIHDVCITRIMWILCWVSVRESESRPGGSGKWNVCVFSFVVVFSQIHSRAFAQTHTAHTPTHQHKTNNPTQKFTFELLRNFADGKWFNLSRCCCCRCCCCGVGGGFSLFFIYRKRLKRTRIRISRAGESVGCAALGIFLIIF